MDKFFTQLYCDRCGKSLKEGRIMSMFNTDCICLDCLKEEKEHKDYFKAVEANHAEIKNGNYNFGGIGYKKER